MLLISEGTEEDVPISRRVKSPSKSPLSDINRATYPTRQTTSLNPGAIVQRNVRRWYNDTRRILHPLAAIAARRRYRLCVYVTLRHPFPCRELRSMEVTYFELAAWNRCFRTRLGIQVALQPSRPAPLAPSARYVCGGGRKRGGRSFARYVIGSDNGWHSYGRINDRGMRFCRESDSFVKFSALRSGLRGIHFWVMLTRRNYSRAVVPANRYTDRTNDYGSSCSWRSRMILSTRF